MPGFQTPEQKNLPSLGQTLELTFKFQLAAVPIVVDVVATPPLIDARSTTISDVIDSIFANSIPLPGRGISDVVYITPGVSNSGSIGRGNPSISGGSGLDNQFVIDGVNVTNMGFGALDPSPRSLDRSVTRPRSISSRKCWSRRAATKPNSDRPAPGL